VVHVRFRFPRRPAFQRDLWAAKKDPAWNFSGLANRSALEKRVRSELVSRLLWQKDQPRELDATIARCSALAKARKKPVKKQQTDLPF
jgi:hypothetical protein